MSMWRNAANSAVGVVQGNYVFQVDGVGTGTISEVSGGEMERQVNAETAGPINRKIKGIGGKGKPSHLKFKVNMGGSRDLAHWLMEESRSRIAAKTGHITQANADYGEFTRWDFNNLLVASMTIPTLDASGGEGKALQPDVELAYTSVRSAEGSGSRVQFEFDAEKAKAWTVHKFEFEFSSHKVPELNGVQMVSKIDGIGFKRDIKHQFVGAYDEPTLIPGDFDPQDITLTIPTQYAGAWYRWSQMFFGQMGGEKDTAGYPAALRIYGGDNVQHLATIEFEELSLTQPKMFEGLKSGSQDGANVSFKLAVGGASFGMDVQVH